MTTSPSVPSSRPWQDIARDLAKETDRKRIVELADELDQALKEQESSAKPKK